MFQNIKDQRRPGKETDQGKMKEELVSGTQCRREWVIRNGRVGVEV